MGSGHPEQSAGAGISRRGLLSYSALLALAAGTGSVAAVFGDEAPALASVPWTHPFLQRQTIPTDGEYNNFAAWRQALGYGPHSGIDLGVGGMTIYNCGPGTVTWAGLGNGQSSWGYWVEVTHSDGTSTGYSHMRSGSIAVSINQVLSGPTELGRAGGTTGGGATTLAEHLHLTRYVGSVSNRSDPTFLATAPLPTPGQSYQMSGEYEMLMIRKGSPGAYEWALFGPGFWYEIPDPAGSGIANGMILQITGGNTSLSAPAVTSTVWDAIKAAALRVQEVRVVP